MQNFRLLVGTSLAITAMMAMPFGYAESAPVYDADTMQQQFENPGDLGQDLPPPPAPGQEAGSAFVPAQQPAAASPSLDVQPAPGPSGGVSQRLARIEQQVANLQSNGAATRVDTLQGEVQALRNQIEQLTHQVQQLQSQQKNLYADLDKRLTQQASNKTVDPIATPTDSDTSVATPVTKTSHKLSVAAKKPVTPPTVATPATPSTEQPVADQPNVAEEQQIYQSAYNLIKAKKYTEAVNTLQKMLQKYPSGQFAANAHYWLGELYGLMNKNDQALTEFSTVVKTYPDSPRISDAQLKVGLIYASQFKWADARTAFKKVINQYPGTASAKLAAEQLKQIKQAGH